MKEHGKQFSARDKRFIPGHAAWLRAADRRVAGNNNNNNDNNNNNNNNNDNTNNNND